MSSERGSVSNEVMLLGAGVDVREDGSIYPSAVGLERADRFLSYYADHKRAFSSHSALVICSGGYGLLAKGTERPDDDRMREGNATADYLMQRGVPHQLIETEVESVSTLTNLTNSIALGHFNPANYNSERKLGLVSQPKHLLRAQFLAGKLGMPPSALTLIATPEKDNTAQEFLLRIAYRALFAGAHGAEQLERREKLPEVILGALRRK